MHNFKQVSIFFLLGLFVLLSCNPKDDPIPIIDEGPVLYDFSFLRQNNAGLIQNVEMELDSNRFTGSAPKGTRVRELVASFKTLDNTKVFVDGIQQISGSTKNDFSTEIQYEVLKDDGDIELFEVALESVKEFPLIHISTENSEGIYSKEDYIYASIKIEGKGQFSDLDWTTIKIRGRGNSTWGLHPKKPYQIKFEEKYPMLDMPEDKRWLFLAEYSDKTFLRNRIAFELGYMSKLKWTTKSEYAALVLNGENQGLYHISQKVEESSNRVDIEEDGFLLEIDQLDRLDADDVYFYSNEFLLNIKEPELEKNSDDYAYIKTYILEFEQKLFSSSFKDPLNGYRKYIDVESVVDWYLINEIAKNVDARSFASIFMHMNQGEKLKFGPIWDFDLGFGNVNYSDSEFPEEFWIKDHAWIDRMFDDPYFVSLLKKRMTYFKSKEQDIYDLIDQQSEFLYDAQKKNDDIWHTIGVWVWPNSKVYSTYEEEVDFLKYWFALRISWLDQAIQQL